MSVAVTPCFSGMARVYILYYSYVHGGKKRLQEAVSMATTIIDHILEHEPVSLEQLFFGIEAEELTQLKENEQVYGGQPLPLQSAAAYIQ